MAEAQALYLVPADGDHEGAVLAVIDGAAGRRLERVAEGRPALKGFESQGQQQVGARLVLGGRGQHAGGREARAAADALALDHDDGAAGLRQAPSDGEADQPGAHHGHVGAGRQLCRAGAQRQGPALTDRGGQQI